ncbi:hypothetical protein [Streptomyces sp. NPDC006368]|uniref:hypothetical protein n=1 Tax=Streptomyces sp. NPDC006368 TaxID=3156760 RepID=UPI00339F7405
MSAQLKERAGELAAVLWREHTVYRDRSGGVVIRGEHVQRWISLAPAGGRDEILVRAGRILDGGTTAPARSEAIMPLAAGTGELAATCRRLLAEAAADVTPRTPRAGARTRRPRRPGKPARSRGSAAGRRRHTGFASWLVLLCVGAVVAYHLYGIGLFAY